MDAFVIAFRLPDAARRMFGEGTLGISFIPVFTKTWNEDRPKAWAILSAMLLWVFVILTAFVLTGETVCWIGYTFFSPESKVYLVSLLLALLLPYLIVICLAAIAAATLQSIGHFLVPALIPSILNIVWLTGIIVLSNFYSGNPAMQCFLLSMCILIAGLIQFCIQIPVLHSLGLTFLPEHFALRQLFRPEIVSVLRGFLPQFFGLMALQVYVITASLIAWLFSGPADEMIRWLGRVVTFPMLPGAASAIYFSERIYEFPLGLFGIAISTAIYPLLSRHAASNDYQELGADLTLGVRIQLALGIPASFGLMLLSEKLAHLLFQRGAFTPMDTFRTADVILYFAMGVWAFSTLPTVIRAFYVLGDYKTPCKVGVIGILCNVLLGFCLIWPMQERGLAFAVSITAAGHLILLGAIFAIKHGYINFRQIIFCACRAFSATLIMGGTVWWVMTSIPGTDSVADMVHILAASVVGTIVYFFAFRLFGGREIGILIRGRDRREQ